jgi:hypothetical protein
MKHYPFIIEYHIRFQMANIWFSYRKYSLSQGEGVFISLNGQRPAGLFASAKMPITKLPQNGYGYSCNRNRFPFFNFLADNNNIFYK